MNMLAIDTAGSHCRVGILRADGRILVSSESSSHSHSRCILSAIDSLLLEAAISLQDLQLLVWNAGPGSFTGIRIAASVVQSLCYSLNIPFLALSSLEILASTAPSLHGNGQLPQYIQVALDARMNGVYWASFVCEDNTLVRIEQDQLVSKEKFLTHCEHLDAQTVVVGDAWPSTVGKVIAFENTIELTIALALTKSQQNWESRAELCLPHYVQVDVGWQKRVRIQSE